MDIKTQLGKKIKKLRLKRGFTQEKLAEMINVSQRTLSGIEIGENFLTAETLDKIIVALNSSAEELFYSDHLKNTQTLIDEITQDILALKKEPEKVENIYKVVKAIIRD